MSTFIPWCRFKSPRRKSNACQSQPTVLIDCSSQSQQRYHVSTHKSEQSGTSQLEYEAVLNRNNKCLEERLINSVRKLYPFQQINCSLENVEERVQLHISRFKRALSKARVYAKRPSYEAGFVLWIACHLFDLMQEKPFCFYCGKRFNDSDFMGPEVQLEHFIPRSKSSVSADIDPFLRRAYPAHHPHRIVLACANCNGIKSNHSDKDFLQVLHYPEAFFKGRRYRPDRREQLREFAAIYYFFIVAPQGYADRNGIGFVDASAHWEARRASYRKRWH